jgi:hypothetical protein
MQPPILPYIMQNQSQQIPDIENGFHRVGTQGIQGTQDMNTLEKIHQRITKLETAVEKLNKFVDTSCAGACATFCASVVRLGLDILLIYVATLVLS